MVMGGFMLQIYAFLLNYSKKMRTPLNNPMRSLHNIYYEQNESLLLGESENAVANLNFTLLIETADCFLIIFFTAAERFGNFFGA